MKNSRYNIFIKLISVICLIAILFTSCVPYTNRKEEATYISAEYSGNEYHRTTANNYQVISKSGLIELLFDKNTTAIAIRDTNSGALWSSLPDTSIKKKIPSSAIQVTLSDGGNKIYTLNSQDNAVAHGNFTYTASADGISVTYSMALDKETGTIPVDKVNSGKLRADVTVLYTLRDGSFYTNVSMNNVHLPEGVFLEEITVLDSFGAYEKSGAEDYIFVPDGSGAIIKTGISDEAFTPVSLAVYGRDIATSDNFNTSPCLVGAFGIKKDSSAFLCIIEKGDAIAEIKANRNNEATLNSVNATFKITDIYSQDIQGNQYKDEITLCYRFLSGKSATYSGMATACRENLIRNSVLSTKTVDAASSSIPMIVSVQGGYKDNEGEYHTLSSYANALSLVSLLKAKGVDNIYLRYNGLYNNANNGNTDDFDEFKSKLGTDKEFDELYSYLVSQKFSLFIDTDILTYRNQLSGAKALNKKSIVNTTQYDFPKSTSSQEFVKLSRLENRVEKILRSSEKVSFDGYALNDMGSYLYSDYSYNTYSRTLAKSHISSQISALSTSKMLMVDTGNFYSVRNADVITNIPVSPIEYKESDAYIGIPFVQMLLHGILEYSSMGFNTYDDSRTAFLKGVEYGCLPSADWYCTTYTEELDEKFYYDKNINDIVTYYTKANDSLSTLRDSRMTSHSVIQNGVYCTEYDNSIKVYVNYTDEEITTNGVIIPAKDCITIF
ncbi:MAG: hypothetical protein IJZ16_02045 [Clostridia bacterium]|nr:hypothetical protein [Clostridia bacterium]